MFIKRKNFKIICISALGDRWLVDFTYELPYALVPVNDTVVIGKYSISLAKKKIREKIRKKSNSSAVRR